MEILIEESKVGTLKLSSLVIKKFIYMLLINDNYQLILDDVDVLMLETNDITAINNNNIVVRIKLAVNPTEDLVNLKNKINNLILKRTESALNLFLLNIHIIFIAQTKGVEINMQEQKKITQHHKRIGMMEVLYQYFLEGQSQQAFKQFLFEEEGKSLITEQCDILNKIIDYEYDLIDLINKNLKQGWDFENLKPVEQAILILAVYEIAHTKTDKKIIINEAIIITKAYCPNDAYKYINGVLDKINK